MNRPSRMNVAVDRNIPLRHRTLTCQAQSKGVPYPRGSRSLDSMRSGRYCPACAVGLGRALEAQASAFFTRLRSVAPICRASSSMDKLNFQNGPVQSNNFCPAGKT